MSRRSMHTEDDDLQTQLLPKAMSVDSGTPLLRQGTLPHAGGPSTAPNVRQTSPVHLDFDSNDDDNSSVDSGPHKLNSRSRYYVDPQQTGTSLDDLTEGFRRLQQEPGTANSSHTPTPLPALMVVGGPRRGVASLRPKRIKRISQYILGPLMGEGTLGHVRDAIDLSKQVPERVAVKTIRRKHRSERELQRVAALLENEVEHLQRYHHPNIIRAVDIFHRDGKDYIVLPIATCSLDQLVQFRRKELSKRRFTMFSDKASVASGLSILNSTATSQQRFGTSLTVPQQQPSLSHFNFTPRSLFPVQLVKDMIFQVLSGLAYIHKQGVSHNDVKPANVLLFNDGVVKLADFGACSNGFKGRGTPAFVSPQVANGVHGVSEVIDGRKNDVWACGVMLFYLLTNMMPFHQKSEYELYVSIARCEVNFDLVPSEDSHAAQHGLEPLPPSPQNDTGSSRSVGSQQQRRSPNGSFAGASMASSFAPTAATAKSLLRLLLEKNQEKRISATEALEHPWLASCGSNNAITEMPLVAASASPSRAPYGNQPSSPEEKRITASAGYLRRVVCNVKELSAVVEKDADTHLQFVCEAASTAGIAIPSIVFRHDDEPDSDDEDFTTEGILTSTVTEPTRISAADGGATRQNGNNRSRTDTTATTAAQPTNRSKDPQQEQPPRGVVYRNRFLGAEELAHYGRKGRPECDVRSLKLDLPKRALVQDYLLHLMAVRGYYGLKKQREALNLPDDEADDKKKRKCCIIC